MPLHGREKWRPPLNSSWGLKRQPLTATSQPERADRHSARLASRCRSVRPARPAAPGCVWLPNHVRGHDRATLQAAPASAAGFPATCRRCRRCRRRPLALAANQPSCSRRRSPAYRFSQAPWTPATACPRAACLASPSASATVSCRLGLAARRLHHTTLSGSRTCMPRCEIIHPSPPSAALPLLFVVALLAEAFSSWAAFGWAALMVRQSRARRVWRCCSAVAQPPRPPIQQPCPCCLPPLMQYGPILLGTVLIHELGHALAARKVGGHAHGILLWPLGGLVYVGHDCGPKGRGICMQPAAASVTQVRHALLGVRMPGLGWLVVARPCLAHPPARPLTLQPTCGSRWRAR